MTSKVQKIADKSASIQTRTATNSDQVVVGHGSFSPYPTGQCDCQGRIDALGRQVARLAVQVAGVDREIDQARNDISTLGSVDGVMDDTRAQVRHLGYAVAVLGVLCVGLAVIILVGAARG